jgi:murein DD-endopeptidase MepM/ murein hydrolase activator NlpD
VRSNVRSIRKLVLASVTGVLQVVTLCGLSMAAAQASTRQKQTAVPRIVMSAQAASQTVVTAKRPSRTLPKPTPVMFALPSVPKPAQSLVVDKKPVKPLTTLEYAATLRSPLSQLSISSPYGTRVHPVKKKKGFHYGVDYVAASGTPIRAAQDGTIRNLGKRRFYGNHLRIDHGHGVETVYGHLLKFMPGLKNGSVIRRGDIIGFVGATGRATGAHLHFEVLANGKQVDPLRLTMAFAPDRLLSMK